LLEDEDDDEDDSKSLRVGQHLSNPPCQNRAMNNQNQNKMNTIERNGNQNHNETIIFEPITPYPKYLTRIPPKGASIALCQIKLNFIVDKFAQNGDSSLRSKLRAGNEV
jgi:hypothetical protein